MQGTTNQCVKKIFEVSGNSWNTFREMLRRFWAAYVPSPKTHQSLSKRLMMIITKQKLEQSPAWVSCFCITGSKWYCSPLQKKYKDKMACSRKYRTRRAPDWTEQYFDVHPVNTVTRPEQSEILCKNSYLGIWKGCRRCASWNNLAACANYMHLHTWVTHAKFQAFQDFWFLVQGQCD